MGNKVTLTFAGDADSLSKASKKTEDSLAGVDKSADKTGKDLESAGKSSNDFGSKVGHLGSAVSGANDALETIGGSLSAIDDLQNAAANRAARLARSLNDVEQAQEDYNQALRDGSQAAIDSGQAELDLEQANLDAATALAAYNKAVKEHGKGSAEARQAAIDLKQAQLDVKQANEDSEQATRDLAQSTIDAKGAQLDLNEANTEAHPTDLSKWAEQLNLVTPLLSAVVGVVGLVTAAQWLWNTALFASPVTWIVLAIVALVAIIVLIATKTTWFQDIWTAAWGGIKDAASWAWDGIKAGAKGVWDYLGNVWAYITSLPDKLKNAFAAVNGFITAPFKAAFNFVADAWNHTIGSLHWTVPGWVPGIGGNSFSAPHMPKFHQGGIVPGGLGDEALAIVRAGERISPAGGGDHAEAVELRSSGSEWDDMILRSIRRSVDLRGGDPVRVMRSTRG